MQSLSLFRKIKRNNILCKKICYNGNERNRCYQINSSGFYIPSAVNDNQWMLVKLFSSARVRNLACLIHKLVGASFQEVDDSCDQEAVLVGIGGDIRTDYHNFKERVVDFF